MWVSFCGRGIFFFFKHRLSTLISSFVFFSPPSIVHSNTVVSYMSSSVLPILVSPFVYKSVRFSFIRCHRDIEAAAYGGGGWSMLHTTWTCNAWRKQNKKQLCLSCSLPPVQTGIVCVCTMVMIKYTCM